MTANRKNSSVRSDLAKVEAHQLQPQDYDDIPELTDADLARGTWMKNGAPITAEEGQAAFTRRLRGRPNVAKPKKTISIRLSDDVLTALKATGKGWQTYIEATLRRSLGLKP